MGTELDVLNQILNREIANIICRVDPRLAPFTSIATKKVHDYVDPYIMGFIGGDGKVDTETAAEFAKSKANSEIEAFKAKLK